MKISLPISKYLVEGLDHHRNGRHIEAFKSFLKAAESGSAIAKLNLWSFMIICNNSEGKGVCPFDESLDYDLFDTQKESVLANEFREHWRGCFRKLVLSAGEIKENEIESIKELSNSAFAHPGRLVFNGSLGDGVKTISSLLKVNSSVTQLELGVLFYYRIRSNIIIRSIEGQFITHSIGFGNEQY